MTSRPRPLRPSSEWTGPAADQTLYHQYTVEEDKRHTNVHYEQPPEFFYAFTGGEWNIYSANLWTTGAADDTASQEAKLDLLAQHMRLQPGQRILDVGCGWGGPLVYLSKKYGVSGVGLTLSPTQKRYAEERIAKYGADVEIVECHWKEYRDDRPFDAVYTDEVIVHFSDLGGFFAKARELLRPGGMMVNKELHYTTSRHKQLSRADVFVNEIYGLTGNYRTLGDELRLLDEHDFALRAIQQLPMENYKRTAEAWLGNMFHHRHELKALVGEEYYRQFRTYLRIVLKMTTIGTMSLDIVAGEKI
ncbi:MAG TPA: class I SAM-dependent methyltransferase [Thermomicrobiales bacterium]|nr:class I SAM-dependent methyltransferase [Thermomicrobiales bacterium]